MARTLSRTGAIAALVAAVVLHAVNAFAQAGWGTAPFNLSTPVSTGGAIFQPKVDVDGAGNAFAIWTDQGPNGIGTGAVVRSARYDVGLRQWSGPLTLSTGERIATAGDIAADAAGNAVAVWRINTISTPFFGRASRYDGTTRQWTYVDLGPLNFAVDQIAVALNDGGAGAVCWSSSTNASISCKRYAPSAGWADAEGVPSAAGLLDVIAVDGAGHIRVLWHTSSAVQTARFDAGTSTWDPVVTLATGLPGPASPGSWLAMNAAGDAIATWSRGATLEARRLPAGSSTWTPAATLASGGLYNEAARAAVAGNGAITVAWTHTDALARTIQVARYDPVADAWGPPSDLPGQGTSAYGPPAIDVNPLGNVHVVWSQSLVSPLIRVMASRFTMATGQWQTVANLSAINQSAYVGDVAIDPAGNATAVWFQAAGGFSLPQALQWRATPAEPLVSSVTTTSGGLTVSFSPHAGSDPALAPTNIEYSVDGGVTWTPRSPADPTSPLTITGLVDGTRYALQLRAVNAAGAGTATPAVAVRSGTSTAPTGLRVAARSGRSLTFAWLAPAAGVVPDAYVVQGGLAGTSQVLAAIPTGGAATQFTLTAPAGRFFVQVAGVSASGGSGPASAPVTIVTDDSAPPSMPAQVLVSRSLGVIALSWTQALEDSAVSGTRVFLAGRAFQTIDLAPTESVTGPQPTSAGVSAAIAATHAALTSPFTPAVPISGAPCAGPPLPPTAFSATTQSGLVYLDWLPPASGEAVTSYMVSVTGAFTGTLPMTARTMAAPVPPGSYTVRVASVGLCGTSAFTAPQTIVVP